MPDDAPQAVRTLSRLARLLECSLDGLSFPQYRVLAAVDEGGDRTTHLACDLAVAKPTITAAVDGLVIRGYLKREPVPQDRRSIRIALTPAGKRALQEAERTMGAALARVLADTGEPASLLKAIAGLGAALDAGPAGPAGADLRRS
ncbi:MAG: MarR family transcriptional regulator [Actinobacteria bacterium]|nr:MarR family transcriptional regulator [Actinomycetota bacterium]